MKNFDFKPDNLGGLLQLYAIPPHSFVRLREDYIAGTHHLEVTKKDDIIELPVLENNTYSFVEEHLFTDAGDTWQVTIEGFAPYLDSSHEKMIHQLERGIWYLLVLDANGVPHWCGQSSAFLTCTARKESGQGASALNGTYVTFSCVQDEPTVVVAEDFNLV